MSEVGPRRAQPGPRTSLAVALVAAALVAAGPAAAQPGDDPVGADPAGEEGATEPGGFPEDAAPDEPPEDAAPDASPEDAAPGGPSEDAAPDGTPADATPDVATPARAKVPVRFKPSGHVKTFGLATFPYESVLLPPEASGSGVVDARLNLALDVGRVLRVEAAHAITATLGGGASAGLFSTGVGLTAPELLPLTWTAFDEAASLAVQGRTDRLSVRLSAPGVSVTVGRQPITFGTGLFFTPLDLINPFTPATVDSEYKPGVDALRVDGFIGGTTRLTALVAYVGAGPPGEIEDPRDALAVAAQGQGTVGVTDLGLFYGYLRRDHVVGASIVTALGPVGFHADAAVTVPPDGDTPFFRGVVGLDGRPGPTTFLAGEVYVQTVGAPNADGYLAVLTSERAARGELWLAGIGYVALSVSQEITPLLSASLAAFMNVRDPSALLAPALSWDVASNATLGVGGYVGIGARPDDPDLLALGQFLAGDRSDEVLAGLGVRSELGLIPGVVFVRVAAYF